MRAAGDSGMLFVSIWTMRARGGVDFLLSPALCLSPLLHPGSLEGFKLRAKPGAGTQTGVDGGRKVRQKMLHEGKEAGADGGDSHTLSDMLPRQPQYFKIWVASKLALKFMTQSNVPLEMSY